MTIRVLYLAHDLSDAAIWRRVEMLESGGAKVHVAGLQRAAAFAGPAHVLAQARDGALGQRIVAVARGAARLRRLLRDLPRPDVIVARNLEMLALARSCAGAVPVVYECLDVHRLMLRGDPLGAALRALEARLGRGVHALWISSPAFQRQYFERFGTVRAPVRLIENKVMAVDGAARPRATGTPLRIGWFGILRCARSLAFLDAVTRAAGGGIKVSLRGRPALDAVPQFHKTVAANPYLQFDGAYSCPDDLPGLYGDVHFAWLIDWFQAGENSEWLLPNRLYEGCAHGAVPIARAGTEVARFLKARGIGVIADVASPNLCAAQLVEAFATDWPTLSQAVATQPRATWVTGSAECRALVQELTLLSHRTNLPLPEGAFG